MTAGRMTKVYRLLLIIVFVCSVPQIVSAKEMDRESQTVKVGYLISSGFQEGREGEYKTGQGYEYLQKIASYTGWKYEYVYGDFEELLQKLKEGKIDIMGNLSYTKERAKSISFGGYEQGRESFCVYVNEEKSSILSDDYSTLNGKKIGVSKGTIQEKLWKKWCKEQKVHCKIIEFRNVKERQKALSNGSVDAVLGSLVANSDEVTKDWRSVFSFGSSPYYFGVNIHKPELLLELNKAQGKILNENPYYNEELNTRYITNGLKAETQLYDDEKKWLSQHKEPLKIGCLTDCRPVSNVVEDGKVQGVLPDILSAIQKNYKKYSLNYEIIAYTDYKKMISDLKEGIIDIAGPVYGDYWNADREEISLTDPFMSTTMLLLQKGNFSDDEIKSLGLYEQNPLQIIYAEIYYPKCKRVLYSSMKAVAKAIKDGDVDAGLATASSYHVNAILHPELGKLNRSTLPNGVNISMAVSRQNPELLSLINRCLANVGKTHVYNSLAKNSNVAKKVTLRDYINANPLATVGICGVIILLLLIVILRLKKANMRARTDAMTGLLNKVSMRELMKDEIKRGGALFVVDIDNFKTINDVLGHDAGDRVIMHFSTALQKIFRSGDLISRFGGDEFVVFLSGTGRNEEVLENKVKQMQESLACCEVFLENKQRLTASTSVGIYIIEKNETVTYQDAFVKADTALYEAKKKGKNTFIIV